MSKIIEINKNGDKEQSFEDLENRIVDNIERHKELISYQIKNLEGIYDFSNSILYKNNEVIAYNRFCYRTVKQNKKRS